MNRKLATAAALFVTFAAVPVFADDSAYQQLVNANSGTQSTGLTFDGSQKPQPSDAYPAASSTSTYSASNSSGTASGYTVSNSSTTTTATPTTTPTTTTATPAGTKTEK